MAGEPRFSIMHAAHFDEVNEESIRVSLQERELHGIIDEEGGGIIAYAIGEEHAAQIVKALTAMFSKET